MALSASGYHLWRRLFLYFQKYNLNTRRIFLCKLVIIFKGYRLNCLEYMNDSTGSAVRSESILTGHIAKWVRVVVPGRYWLNGYLKEIATKRGDMYFACRFNSFRLLCVGFIIHNHLIRCFPKKLREAAFGGLVFDDLQVVERQLFPHWIGYW